MTEPQATQTADTGEMRASREPSPALEDARKFVAELQALRERDRGRMAELRRNAGDTLPGHGTAWFYGYLYSQRRQRYAEIHFLVATLFDLNRKRSESGDFGAALRRAASSANEEAMKRRFRILLDTTFDRIHDPLNEIGPWQDGGGELAYRLRQTVRLLASKEVGVDWAQLLVDLCWWSHPKKLIQKKWARSFFGAPSLPEPVEPDDTEEPAETVNA